MTQTDDRSAIVEFHDVSFSYGGAPVLEDVNLCLREGGYICIIGPNGGGKTTLLKLLLGLLEPTRGRVEVFGRPPQQARRLIGYMPQHGHFDPLFPVTVMDVVLMGRLGARWWGRYSRADADAAHLALEEMDLDDLARRPFAALSGGQRQRVLIARALACDPKLLLMDEPTANLDPEAEDEFYKLMRRLNQRLTVVIVSHDLGFVSQFVQSVVCVNRRVVEHPTSEIDSAHLRELYGRDVRMVRHEHQVEGGSHG